MADTSYTPEYTNPKPAAPATIAAATNALSVECRARKEASLATELIFDHLLERMEKWIGAYGAMLANSIATVARGLGIRVDVAMGIRASRRTLRL
jgi:hypothetical protein